MKKIAILGSTGSIGRQALQVVDEFSDLIQPVALTAGQNRELLLQQVLKYQPPLVSVGKEQDAAWLRQKISGLEHVKIVSGSQGLQEVACFQDADTVVTAVSGAIGLEPTVSAIENGKNIALANKETLVAAGQLVMSLVQKNRVQIIPVDSEHSAIWQCLKGENKQDVAQIILTASGGPFHAQTNLPLEQITPQMALAHPNWSMGPKITIDSATLMNKGLEVIEARWLFDVDYTNIKVVVHPQSIIHSMVEFNDGNVIAQLAMPDMRLPIQYALLYPHRLSNEVPKLKWPIGGLTFAEPDLKRFPALSLAYEAGKIGGTMPAVLNAANEVAVAAFLAGQISFLDITNIVQQVMEGHTVIKYQQLQQVLEADQWARTTAQRLCQ